jgi:hypothetical protein
MSINIASNFSVNTSLPIDSRFTFQTIAERDLLNSSFRYIGLFTYVVLEQKYYYLKSGITNSDWTEFAFGTGNVSGFDANTILKENFIVDNIQNNDFEMLNYEGSIDEMVILNGQFLIENDGIASRDYYIYEESDNRFFIHINGTPLISGDIVTVVYMKGILTGTGGSQDISMKADKIGIDDIEITNAGKGIILRSDNGTRWRIGVTNNGNLTVENI